MEKIESFRKKNYHIHGHSYLLTRVQSFLPSASGVPPFAPLTKPKSRRRYLHSINTCGIFSGTSRKKGGHATKGAGRVETQPEEKERRYPTLS